MKKKALLFFITINSFSQEKLFERVNELVCDSLEIIVKEDKLKFDRVNDVVKNCTKKFTEEFSSEIIKYRVYNNGDDSVFFDYYLYQISINCELYRSFYLEDLNADFINSDFIYNLLNSADNSELKIAFDKSQEQVLINAKKELNEIRKNTVLYMKSIFSENQIVYINSFFLPLKMEEIYRIELTFNNNFPQVLTGIVIKNKSDIKTEYSLRAEELKKYKNLPLPAPSPSLKK